MKPLTSSDKHGTSSNPAARVRGVSNQGRSRWARLANAWSFDFLGARFPYLLCAIVVSSALTLWLTSLSGLDPKQITDYGLVSILPAQFYVALAILTLSFASFLRQERRLAAVLLLHIVALIVILHATIPLIYEVPRYGWTYKHMGVVNYIQHYGSVEPKIDAYHNWPGFFTLSALFTDLAGFASPLDFVTWAQLFFNLLYIGPLLIVLRVCTQDQRLVWLALWFFYLTSWVGQDYFAPQALTFFFYIVIMGACLTWFKATSPSPRPFVRHGFAATPTRATLFRRGRPRELDNTRRLQDGFITHPGQRFMLAMVVLFLFSVVVSSHQLTPFMSIAAASALIVFRRCNFYSLPFLMMIITVCWGATMAQTYLANHTHWYTSIGSFGSNIDTNLTDADEGTPGHIFVTSVTRLLTLTVWGLAGVGIIRRVYLGRWDITVALLAGAPFPMLLAQSYGGEMLLRIYFFSLPFVIFFAAAAVYPSEAVSNSRWRTLAIGVISGIFLFGFLFAHYGNERGNYFSRQEVNAMQYVYNRLPRGSLIMSVTTDSYPARLSGAYPEYIHRSFEDHDVELTLKTDGTRVGVMTFDLDEVTAYMTDDAYTASYLVLTAGQRRYSEQAPTLPVGTYEQLQKDVTTSERFELVFENPDAQIFRLKRGGEDQAR